MNIPINRGFEGKVPSVRAGVTDQFVDKSFVPAARGLSHQPEMSLAMFPLVLSKGRRPPENGLVSNRRSDLGDDQPSLHELAKRYLTPGMCRLEMDWGDALMRWQP